MSEDTFSPGYVESVSSTKRKSKEDLRIDELIPHEIQKNIGEGGIKTLLQKYYEFMNMDEFTYQTTESFNDILLTDRAVFRYPDPDGTGNSFFTDDNGANSTLVLSKAGENDVTINLLTNNAVTVAISNGNDLPGSLAQSTSDIGKTFSVVWNPDASDYINYNGWSAKLTTLIRNWVGPGPSYILNALEDAMDIDKNLDQDGQLTQDYLEMMQKEIAASIPADLQANKSVLYKRIIDFYKVRGSDDSIETFFRLFFNEEVEVERPYDNTLIPSAGDWSPSINQFLSTKGFISEKDIRIHDSYRYQKYSYLIKSGRNVADWKDTFNKLVHPAGFIFFGEILILLQLTRAAFGDSTKPITVKTKNPQTGLLVDQLVDVYGNTNRKTLSSMPGIQPGVIGVEDLPFLIEMFISMFTPNPEVKANRRAVMSPVVSGGAVSSITIVQKGSGYLSAPTISITGDGNGASATATINSLGEIVSVSVTGGSGYTTADISVDVPKDSSNNDSTTKIGSINIYNRIKRKYRKEPTIRIDAPTAVDSDGALLSSNVQATAEFLLNSTKLEYGKVLNGGSGYTSEPTVSISQPQTHYTAAPFFTENFTGATISTDTWANGWRVIDTSNHTASVTTIDSSSVLQVQTTTLDTNASGSVGGAVYKLSLGLPHNTYHISGNTVKVKCRAKKPSSGGASFFEMAYSTSQHGNSGWQRKTLTTDWQDFEFEYNISSSTPTNEDYVGFQSDGSNGIVYIDDVSITVKYDTAEARAQISNGQVQGIDVTYQGSGYTQSPTFTISGGGGSNATVEGLLVPSTIASINITNAGSGYVRDPVISILSKSIDEHRAKDTQMIINLLVNHLSETTNNYFNSKGNRFGNTPYTYNSNLTIDQIGTQIIQNNYQNSINSYNTNSFVTLD